MPKDEYLEWRYNGGGRIPVGFDGVMHKEDDIELESGEGLVTERPASDELHHYMLLRARFIWGAANGEGRKSSQITSSFDFGRYLDNCLGETLEKIVIVHEFTWIAIAVVMVVMYALFERSSDAGSCIILTLIGFLLAGALIWLNFKLSKILVALSPPPESNVRQVLTGHKAAAPAYEALPPVKGMSKHEQLFPFGQKGPDFLIHFLRTTLLLAAVFIVGLFSVFWNLMSANNLHWLLPICLISIAVCMALVRPVLPRLTIVTSVSLLKRPKMVDLTLREVRLESSIKTMKVLATLQSQIRRLKKMNSRTGGGDANRKERTIDPKQKADLYDAFKLFDEDDSGSIDSKELFNLLRNLGQHVDQAEAERLVLEIDTGVSAAEHTHATCRLLPATRCPLRLAQRWWKRADALRSYRVRLLTRQLPASVRCHVVRAPPLCLAARPPLPPPPRCCAAAASSSGRWPNLLRGVLPGHGGRRRRTRRERGNDRARDVLDARPGQLGRDHAARVPRVPLRLADRLVRRRRRLDAQRHLRGRRRCGNQRARVRALPHTKLVRLLRVCV